MFLLIAFMLTICETKEVPASNATTIELSSSEKIDSIWRALRENDKATIKHFLENSLTVEDKYKESLASIYKKTVERIFRDDDAELFAYILPKGVERIQNILEIQRSLFAKALQKEKKNIFGLLFTKHIDQSLPLSESDVREYLYYYLNKKANNKEVDKRHFDQHLSTLSDINKSSFDGDRLLTLAIKNNHPEITKLLISKGADLNQKNVGDTTALMLAAAKGDIKLFQYLLKNGAYLFDRNSESSNNPDKNDRYEYGKSVLNEAVRGNHMSILKLYPSKKYYNPFGLIHATRLKNTDMIKFFLEMGFNINEKTRYGHTALTEAVKAHYKIDEKDTNEYPVIDFLIDNGAEINMDNGRNGNAIAYAIKSKSIKLVRHLISKGARLDKKTAEIGLRLSDGSFSSAPPVELMTLLIEKGIDLNAKDNNNRTLLFKAIRAKNKELVKLLFEKGFKLDNGVSHIEYMLKSYHDSRYEIVKLLAQYGANPNALDRKGNPIVFRFLDSRSWDKINESGYSANYEVLTSFKKPIKFDIVNKKGESLLTALLNGRRDTDVAKFIFNKVDVDVTDNSGRTVLHNIAAGTIPIGDPRNTKLLKIILDSGADINKKDEQGDTPLHAAVKDYNTAIISILLNYGADPQIKNFAGKTPLDMVEPDSSTHDFFVFYEKLLSNDKLDDYAERHRRVIADKRCYISSKMSDTKTNFVCISDKFEVLATLRKDVHKKGDHLITFNISEPRKTIQNLKDDSVVSSLLQSYNEAETTKLRQWFYKLVSNVEKINPTETYFDKRSTLEFKTTSDTLFGIKVDVLAIQLIITGNK